MSYLVFCTFDLKEASSQDYDNAYSDLKKIGLHKVVQSNEGSDIIIPTTSVIGNFEGETAPILRTNMCEKIKKLFTDRKFKSEIFVIVSGDWAWGGRKT